MWESNSPVPTCTLKQNLAPRKINFRGVVFYIPRKNTPFRKSRETSPRSTWNIRETSPAELVRNRPLRTATAPLSYIPLTFFCLFSYYLSHFILYFPLVVLQRIGNDTLILFNEWVDLPRRITYMSNNTGGMLEIYAAGDIMVCVSIAASEICTSLACG